MERRSFLKWLTNGLGALFGVIIGAPAIVYLIDPRNRPAAAGDFKPVTKLNDLKIGEPAQFVIRDVRRDAWTLHPSDVIGRVWLIRDDEKNVRAYTTICPHLGGSINYVKDSKRFVCPLHGATFDFQCNLVPDKQLTIANPAPRGMDSLDVQPVQDAATGETIIAVKYQSFYPTRAEKIPKT